MTIYVGNLPFGATEEEVNELFSQYGAVQSVKLITDRETGKPRGFGFVEMDHGDAEEAIEGLNGQSFGGRKLQVNEAREKKGGRDGDNGGARCWRRASAQRSSRAAHARERTARHRSSRP